jgi:hypothetical protein
MMKHLLAASVMMLALASAILGYVVAYHVVIELHKLATFYASVGAAL